MADIILHTFDWAPEGARGKVKDMRVRWALEEAGLPYRVATTSIINRGGAHFAHQPFGQVPWLTHGDISVFESGAILLYLSEHSDKLLPSDPCERGKALSWCFAALNSVEMGIQPPMILRNAELDQESPEYRRLDEFQHSRLQHTEAVLKEREWLAGPFSIADILLADVLRTHDSSGGLRQYPACREYVARAVNRPAFKKAYADQMAHFLAAKEPVQN